MMTESRQDNKTLPFIGGMLIGAAAATIFAPRKGEDVRKEMKDKAKEMKDKLENRKQEMKNKKDKLAHKAEEKVEEGQERLDKAKNSGENDRGAKS